MHFSEPTIPLGQLLMQIHDSWTLSATISVFTVIAVLCAFHRPLGALAERCMESAAAALDQNFILRMVLAPIAFGSAVVALGSALLGLVLVLSSPLRMLANLSFGPCAEFAQGFVLLTVAVVAGAFALLVFVDLSLGQRETDGGDDDGGNEADDDASGQDEADGSDNVVSIEGAKARASKAGSASRMSA